MVFQLTDEQFNALLNRIPISSMEISLEDKIISISIPVFADRRNNHTLLETEFLENSDIPRSTLESEEPPSDSTQSLKLKKIELPSQYDDDESLPDPQDTYKPTNHVHLYALDISLQPYKDTNLNTMNTTQNSGNQLSNTLKWDFLRNLY